MSQDLPILALVGRPNVGKSSFFNLLHRRRTAIVEDQPGVTRDRHFAHVTYQQFEFVLIDTGGFEPDSKDSMNLQVMNQSELAIEEADVVLFMTDVRQGWSGGDEEIYKNLKTKGKPVFLVVNKCDNERMDLEAGDFYRAGVETLYPISILHHRGFQHLFDSVNELIPIEAKQEAPRQPDEAIKVAFIGKPNVGKSSLVNALLKEERMIVHDQAGTTRDSIATEFEWKGQPYQLIDTAGIRRKTKVSLKVETFSVVSALRSLERCDIAVLVVDCSEGVSTQMLKVAGYAEERRKPVVIVANKMDLLPESKQVQKEFSEELFHRLHFLDYCPLIFTCANTRKNVNQILAKVNEVMKEFHKRIQTSDLNDIVSRIVQKHSPPAKSGHPTKIYFAQQPDTAPPKFIFQTNHPERIDSAYQIYMARQLRHYFGFKGCPLKLVFKKRQSTPKK